MLFNFMYSSREITFRSVTLNDVAIFNNSGLFVMAKTGTNRDSVKGASFSGEKAGGAGGAGGTTEDAIVFRGFEFLDWGEVTLGAPLSSREFRRSSSIFVVLSLPISMAPFLLEYCFIDFKMLSIFSSCFSISSSSSFVNSRFSRFLIGSEDLEFFLLSSGFLLNQEKLRDDWVWRTPQGSFFTSLVQHRVESLDKAIKLILIKEVVWKNEKQFVEKEWISIHERNSFSRQISE